MPTELLLDGNVDGYNLDSWWQRKSNSDSNHEITWVTEESYSPDKSLKISNQVSDSTGFAFWAQSLYDDIPTGQDVTLKVKIKGNLTGDGVSIVIRGDDYDSWHNNGDLKQFETTEGDTKISGTFDWTEYSLTMTDVTEDVTIMTVYLVYLENTVGEVYFDDASLTY